MSNRILDAIYAELELILSSILSLFKKIEAIIFFTLSICHFISVTVMNTSTKKCREK